MATRILNVFGIARTRTSKRVQALIVSSYFLFLSQLLSVSRNLILRRTFFAMTSIIVFKSLFVILKKLLCLCNLTFWPYKAKCAFNDKSMYVGGLYRVTISHISFQLFFFVLFLPEAEHGFPLIHIGVLSIKRWAAPVPIRLS